MTTPPPVTDRLLRPVASGLVLSALAFSPLASADEPTAQALQQALDRQQEQLEQTQQALEDLRTQIEEAAEIPTDRGPAWSGYAVINYSRIDFYQNVQDDEPDQRARTDLERVVLEAEFELADGIEFETEIEFEHGGTGATVEYESDEFGEYEQEIEKGGEVVIEKAELVIKRSPRINWRLGHIVVPFGMINTHHLPSQYFTTTRSLAETALIPAVWHETGAELFGRLGDLRYQFLVVTGLDSSGFSSQDWIAGGYQQRMEYTNADNPAFVVRLDYVPTDGVVLGGAYYYGDTTDNRDQQNLEASGVVSMWEVHGRYERGPVTVRAEMIQGTVENSDLITAANRNAVNQDVRGISATPVGHAAESYFVEAGYDLLSFFGKRTDRLDVFARYDAYNTMAEVEGSIQANPRYDRSAYTAGLNYKLRPDIVFKAEYSRLENEAEIANEADMFALGLGVEF